LADEPTASLDRQAALRVIDIFKDFNRVGVTVLIATHDETLLSAVSPRVLRLDAGRLDQSLASAKVDP
jgi:cell division transport system ATP-binding protein